MQMAERKGLEPSASGVTGRRYNRLNYRSGQGEDRVLKQVAIRNVAVYVIRLAP